MNKKIILLSLVLTLLNLKSQDLYLNGVNGKNYYVYEGGNTFNGNIFVAKNVILELKCGTYKFNKNKKISVEVGGQLYINNAVLTQVNDNSTTNSNTLNPINNWEGIEVLGDESLNQDQIICSGAGNCNNVTSPKNNLYFWDGPYYIQGYVSINKSKIRYSNKGVSIGTIFQGQFQSGDKGGAILHAFDSKFENNWFKHISFAYYRNKINSAKINNCEFTFDHGTTQWLNLYHYHKSIVADNVSFRYEFQNNIFRVFTIYNNFKAITHNGFMKISKSTFTNFMVGIENLRPYPGILFKNFNFIAENSFDECQLGIYNGSDNTLIRNNNFKSCSYTRTDGNFIQSAFYGVYPGYSNKNATVCIYNDAGLNLKAENNSFVEKYFRISNLDAGLVSNKSSILSSRYLNNSSNKMVNVFRSIDDNRGINFSCNKMKKTRINDILNDANGILSNQGSMTWPAINEFSKLTSQNYISIKNENTNLYSTNKFKYIYKNSSIYNPDPITANTVEKTQGTGSSSCPSDIGYVVRDNGCNKDIIVINGGYGQYINLKGQFLSIKENGISENEEEEFNIISKDYDLLLTQQMMHFSSLEMLDSINAVDSILPLLINHNTLNSKMYLVDLYISTGDSILANQLLDSLSSQYPNEALVADFIQYSNLMIDYKSNNYSLTWLQNHENDLSNIQNNNGFYSSAAKSMLEYLMQKDSTHTNFNQTLQYALLPDLDTEIELEDSVLTEQFSVYPVPFDETLNFKIENFDSFSRTFDIKVKDLAGQVLINQTIVVNANSYEILYEMVGYLTQGFYIVQFYENNTLLDYKLINKL